MTGSKRILIALAASGALAAAAAGGVQAQTPPQGAGGQQQDVPALLHLRPDQMAAFHAFVQARRPTPDEIARLQAASPQALTSLSTPQRLDRIGAFMGAQQEAFRRSAAATRAFYGQLSPDQQQLFDRLSTPPANQGRGRPQ